MKNIFSGIMSDLFANLNKFADPIILNLEEQLNQLDYRLIHLALAAKSLEQTALKKNNVELASDISRFIDKLIQDKFSSDTMSNRLLLKTLKPEMIEK